jgi:uncharacterized protein DUF6907
VLLGRGPGDLIAGGVAVEPDRHLVSVPSSHDEDECPAWCEREHLGAFADRQGFHHDGPATSVPLDAPVAGRPVDLFVNVSQHAHRGDPPGPPLVEVQDEHRTLFKLSPVECLALSRALLDAATQVSRVEETPAARVEPLVRDLEQSLAHWRGQGTG